MPLEPRAFVMNLTIIIPAYNEAARIGTTLESYIQHFRGRARFLVVINGTTDRTADVVKTYARQFPDTLSYVVIPERIGKGGAVHEGFRRVSTDLVAYADADGATGPEAFDRLVKALGDADGVIGSRYLRGAVAERTFTRRVIGFCFHLAVRLFVRLPFRDTQCGYKAFRTAKIKAILPQLTVRNMAFDVELLAMLVRSGARIRELPTVWREIPGSGGWPKNLFQTGFEMFRTLLTIRRRLAH